MKMTITNKWPLLNTFVYLFPQQCFIHSTVMIIVIIMVNRLIPAAIVMTTCTSGRTPGVDEEEHWQVCIELPVDNFTSVVVNDSVIEYFVCSGWHGTFK